MFLRNLGTHLQINTASHSEDHHQRLYRLENLKSHIAPYNSEQSSNNKINSTFMCLCHMIRVSMGYSLSNFVSAR
jgi:hypothetical protein